MTIGQINQVLSQVKYQDWTFELTADAPGHWYLRVKFWAYCPQRGEPAEWTGRKWLLSEHMTRSEIVQTAWKAVLTAVEHEAREAFTYRGKPIFGPHFNVEFLADYCDLPYAQDARPVPERAMTREEAELIVEAMA